MLWKIFKINYHEIVHQWKLVCCIRQVLSHLHTSFSCCRHGKHEQETFHRILKPSLRFYAKDCHKIPKYQGFCRWWKEANDGKTPRACSNRSWESSKRDFSSQIRLGLFNEKRKEKGPLQSWRRNQKKYTRGVHSIQNVLSRATGSAHRNILFSFILARWIAFTLERLLWFIIFCYIAKQPRHFKGACFFLD